MIRDITLNDIKELSQYRYRFIDVKNGKDVKGYIYEVTNANVVQGTNRYWHCYFIDDNETYFKFMRHLSDN